MTAPTLSNGDKTYSAKELTELTAIITKQIMEVQKHAASGTTPTINPPYGPYADGSGDYGVFSIPGIRPDMFSAFQRPRTFANFIGVNQSRNANEKIGIMTGVTAGSGSNPSGFCGTAPTAGQLKRCVQNYLFGRLFMKTNVANLAEVGEYVDYSDVEKRILNLNQNPNPLIPDVMGQLDISDRATALLASELFTVGADIERGLERVLVRGNETLPAASTQRGWINEFRGLERQITTGKFDLDTLAVCPAADSQVITWGTGIDGTVNGRTFPQTIVDTYFGMNDIAEQVGLGGVRFFWLMPMRMFRALTYVYACQYYVNRCAGTVGNPDTMNAAEVAKLQMQMHRGRYLIIDEEIVPVVFSDGITETRASGSVYTAQGCFLLPYEWNGMSMLNLQYKPMNNAEAMGFNGFVGPDDIVGINNGMYLTTKQRTGFCVEMLFAAKMRLIQDCPFLAARIDTIQYSFQAPYRSAYPDDTINYVDGGTTRWDGNYTVTGG